MAPRYPEQEMLKRLGPGFRNGSRGTDIESTSQSPTLINVKRILVGVRDLDAALLQTAYALSVRPEASWGVLVALSVANVTANRIREEWGKVQQTIRPEMGKRLALIARTNDGEVVLPDDAPSFGPIVDAARAMRGAGHAVRRRSSVRWSRKEFDVWRALLDSWLRCEPPLSSLEIGRRSGASYPSIARTLREISTLGELRRDTNRSAMFLSFPRNSLGEVLVLANGLRMTERFIDNSGRQPELNGLLRRTLARAPKGVAIGGVVAARHYMPDFDLNGLPRLDVTVHGTEPLTWLSAVDPALLPQPNPTTAVVLAVHRVLTPRPQFEHDSAQRLPFASPAETLLDLYDLRLTEQAEQFVTAMRGRAHG